MNHLHALLLLPTSPPPPPPPSHPDRPPSPRQQTLLLLTHLADGKLHEAASLAAAWEAHAQPNSTS